MIRYYSPPGAIDDFDLIVKACRETTSSTEVYQRGFFSFAAPEEIARVFADVGLFQIQSEYKLLDFIDCGGKSPDIEPREANNLVSTMFRRAWESFCRSKGLYEHLFVAQTAFDIGEAQAPLGKRLSWGRKGERRSSMLRNSAGGKFLNPATVAWNLATGLYYKTQPEPPRKLAHVRTGVCYIGLVFKMIPNDLREHACCAAQMFLNEGDAVVFRRANGPWQTGDFEFHLKAGEAQGLIAKVLDTCKGKHGKPPKELFTHGRTTFNDEEWNAFKKAAPKGTNVVGVRIKETHGESKLFHDGDYPVNRGTAIILNDRNALLWTNGFVPRLDA